MKIKELKWVDMDSIIKAIASVQQEKNISVNGMASRDAFAKSLKIATEKLKNLQKS